MAHAARSRVLASIAAEYGKADELKPLYADVDARRPGARLSWRPTWPTHILRWAMCSFPATSMSKGRGHPMSGPTSLGGAMPTSCCSTLSIARVPAWRKRRTPRSNGRLLLDPINARVHRAAGSIDYAARRYADALPPLRRALELNPKISNAHALLGYCLMQMGRLKEARAEFDAEPTNFFRLSGLAIVDHKLGNSAAAGKAMADLVSEMGDASLYQQAQVLAQWGMSDEAVARLERARQIGNSGLIYLATDPLLDPIRKHPGIH